MSSRQRLRRRLIFGGQLTRARALTVGLVLAAVPTVFQLFPSFANWNRAIRAGILIIWLLTAILAVRGAAAVDEKVEALAQEKRDLRKKLRTWATREVLAACLRAGAKGIPASYEYTVYLYDEDSGKLKAWYPPWDKRDGADPREFAAGNGATGSSWDTKDTFVVTGSHVSSGKYGLSESQQSYFSQYKTVVATPILEDASTPFGVLTALSKENDGFFGDGAPGQACLRDLADTIAVVLKRIPYASDLR